MLKQTILAPHRTPTPQLAVPEKPIGVLGVNALDDEA